MIVENKVIFITGGSRGIGFAIVKELLKNNAKGVAIVDVAKIENQNEISSFDSKILFIQADITDKKQLEDAFEQSVNFFKQLDIVINNAGIGNEQNWEPMINVNLTAVINGNYLAMQKYLPEYKSGEEGIIINTCSLLALLPNEICPIYTLCKSAVLNLGQSLSKDEFYKKYKVIVLTMCPGLVLTGLHNAPKSIKFVFPHKVKEVMKELKVEPQSAESAAKGFIKMINEGKNGSIWIAENDKPAYEIELNTSFKKKIL